MHQSLRLLVVVFIVSCCPNAYACNFPDPVAVPDGRTASERDMIAADKAVNEYISQLQLYTECIESEVSTARRSARTQDINAAKVREEQAVLKLNDAAAAIEDVAERFNEAIADYTSRNR